MPRYDWLRGKERKTFKNENDYEYKLQYLKGFTKLFGKQNEFDFSVDGDEFRKFLITEKFNY